jgi:hypothetical protein
MNSIDTRAKLAFTRLQGLHNNTRLLLTCTRALTAANELQSTLVRTMSVSRLTWLLYTL